MTGRTAPTVGVPTAPPLPAELDLLLRLALAASFGLLALVPLGPFRELGFLLGVGILIDVFIVRALLVPSLITLVGPLSSWPSGILQRERRTRVRKEPADA